ncbi:Mss4-like protein [Aspergillus tamarii]|uniref:Mss4-like protein n=1 Tax=Aspergillus tamarii TaxID=41984 RepID=A0A5N6UKA0_ASPTM|nr:Mss4-like protein [Aspergillus tamarii]
MLYMEENGTRKTNNPGYDSYVEPIKVLNSSGGMMNLDHLGECSLALSRPFPQCQDTMIHTGQCICKGVGFTVKGPPEDVFCCYCSDCAIGAGGPCQITASYASSNVTVHDPDALLTCYTITNGTISGHAKEKHFCQRCGCTIFTIPSSLGRQYIVIRPVLIENGLEIYQPGLEVFVKRRPSYFAGCQSAKQYDIMPTEAGSSDTKE